MCASAYVRTSEHAYLCVYVCARVHVPCQPPWWPWLLFTCVASGHMTWSGSASSHAPSLSFNLIAGPCCCGCGCCCCCCRDCRGCVWLGKMGEHDKDHHWRPEEVFREMEQATCTRAGTHVCMGMWSKPLVPMQAHTRTRYKAGHLHLCRHTRVHGDVEQTTCTHASTHAHEIQSRLPAQAHVQTSALTPELARMQACLATVMPGCSRM